MTDSNDAAAGTGGRRTPARFVGEEGEDTRSTPRKDLAAALVIGAVSIAAIALAIALPTQRSLLTAPGLLPFIVGLSLLAMSAGLGVRAIRRGATLRPPANRMTAGEAAAAVADRWRVPFLIAVIAAYVCAVDWVTFDLEIPTPLFRISVSSYEVVSAVALAILLKVFWQASILRCLLVSIVWVVFLAAVFRDVFHILLPGSA